MYRIGLLVTKLNGGGAERTVANLSNVFSDKGHEVHIILFDGENISYPFKGQLHDLKLGTTSNIFDKIIQNFKRFKAVKRIKKDYELNVVISFLDTPNLINVLTKSGDCKRLISIRNNLSLENYSYLRRLLIKFCSFFSDKTISISESVKYDLIQNFHIAENKIQTIYNPIDIDNLLDNEEEYRINLYDFKDYFNIVTMGRLTYQKGQWHLINVIKLLVEANKKVRLYILGEGELDDELKKLVLNYKLQNNIIFLGFIKNAHQFMKNCDLFVFSSLYEGLGNVLLEAMSLGLPVISTDCKSGPREIIYGRYSEKIATDIEICEYGILVPPYTQNSTNFSKDSNDLYLANAITLLLDDANLLTKFKKKSLMRSKDFSDDNIYSQWIGVIQNVISKN